MNRAYYSDSFAAFLSKSADAILGQLTKSSEFSVEQTQRDAWLAQIAILKDQLSGLTGTIYFEFTVPRIGHRIDVVLVVQSVIYILEFKVGEEDFSAYAIDQVWDYALDLKYFHEGTHNAVVLPALIATDAAKTNFQLTFSIQNDRVYRPIRIATSQIRALIEQAAVATNEPIIEPVQWEASRYLPCPTIVEAALALYNHHSVADLARTDAGAMNLRETSSEIETIIRHSREAKRKSICFVTGVPGAGKTLVGLNIATQHVDQKSDLYGVFLSGNQPLVDVMREALARDRVSKSKQAGKRTKKGEAMREVNMFIQNVHHFRDDCLNDPNPPREHVAIFDEAQRAWNLEQTAFFMKRKKGRSDFSQSEPEYLISCLDRHPDWAVIVCLVGGGQEINTGEAGISEWLNSLKTVFSDWDIYVSAELRDSEYGAVKVIDQLQDRPNVNARSNLHLATSMRSFRSENVSRLVKQLLDLEIDAARGTLSELVDKYPIVLTRSVSVAKRWLREHARGNERYGVVVSSQALRLKPYAMDVRVPIDPVHWFLDGKDDVRSSFYLKDVATEFHVQGLELDWACVTWDADLRYTPTGWEHHSFVGSRWNKIHKDERRRYQLNAYRVLLTRARQGMVIVVPNGDTADDTRKLEYYDHTYQLLRSVGFRLIEQAE